MDATKLRTSPLAKGLSPQSRYPGERDGDPESGCGYACDGRRWARQMLVKSGEVSYSRMRPRLPKRRRMGVDAVAGRPAPICVSRCLGGGDSESHGSAAEEYRPGERNRWWMAGCFLARPPRCSRTGREDRGPLLAGNNARERTPRAGSARGSGARRWIAMYGPAQRRAPAALCTTPGSAIWRGRRAVGGGRRCTDALWWPSYRGVPQPEMPLGNTSLTAGVAHSLGRKYRLYSARSNSPTDADRRRISDTIQEYWTNFAKTGNPGWQAFTKSGARLYQVHQRGSGSRRRPARALLRPLRGAVKRLVKR